MKLPQSSPAARDAGHNLGDIMPNVDQLTKILQSEACWLPEELRMLLGSIIVLRKRNDEDGKDIPALLKGISNTGERIVFGVFKEDDDRFLLLEDFNKTYKIVDYY